MFMLHEVVARSVLHHVLHSMICIKVKRDSDRTNPLNIGKRLNLFKFKLYLIFIKYKNMGE